jgi:hypothetical protein
MHQYPRDLSKSVHVERTGSKKNKSFLKSVFATLIDIQKDSCHPSQCVCADTSITTLLKLKIIGIKMGINT